MSHNDKAAQNVSTEPIQGGLINEWKRVGKQFVHPLVLIPLIFSILTLYFANQEGVNKSLSITLTIIAAVLSAIAGAAFYDYIKALMGDTLLIKKGDSAVRHLFLVKHQIKNISERVKGKASPEEIVISLSFLEKLITNSIEEWNDIIPGIIKKEAVYELLAEKENELKGALKEKERLNEQLIQEKELKKEEKEWVDNELRKWEKKISELSEQINILKRASGPKPLAQVFLEKHSALANAISERQPALTKPTPALSAKRCSQCGRTYIPVGMSLLDETLCNECQKFKE